MFPIFFAKWTINPLDQLKAPVNTWHWPGTQWRDLEIFFCWTVAVNIWISFIMFWWIIPAVMSIRSFISISPIRWHQSHYCAESLQLVKLIEHQSNLSITATLHAGRLFCDRPSVIAAQTVIKPRDHAGFSSQPEVWSLEDWPLSVGARCL